jgi:hypothetical protein
MTETRDVVLVLVFSAGIVAAARQVPRIWRDPMMIASRGVVSKTWLRGAPAAVCGGAFGALALIVAMVCGYPPVPPEARAHPGPCLLTIYALMSLFVISSVVLNTILLFNVPSFAVPPALRGERGWLSDTWHRLRRAPAPRRKTGGRTIRALYAERGPLSERPRSVAGRFRRALKAPQSLYAGPWRTKRRKSKGREVAPATPAIRAPAAPGVHPWARCEASGK